MASSFNLHTSILHGTGLMISVVLVSSMSPSTAARRRHPPKLHTSVLHGAGLMKKTTGDVQASFVSPSSAARGGIPVSSIPPSSMASC